MKTERVFLIYFLFIFNIAFGQNEPRINISYSKLLSTFDFIQKLSENYPDNDCKKAFESSKFYTRHYTDLVKQLDTLDMYESYNFQGYPIGHRSVMTTTLIEKNLISSTSIQEFKRQTFGIIPNAVLFTFSNILSEFEPIYDSLIYAPYKAEFEKQLNELKSFVQKSNLSNFFQLGLDFYGTYWDNSISTDIAVIPSISKSGFTAKAFMNNAVSEIPINFKEKDILFSVLMHEIYHNIYDAQSLGLKLKIETWFKNNPSKNSQYAYLLLNEALATALGNGFVYEQLNGKIDNGDWYNVKYINLMAKQIYPVVKEYLKLNKQIDKDFINNYIAAYDSNFSDWQNELDYLFINRYVISDNHDNLRYFRKNYHYSSIYQSQAPIDQCGLARMKEMPITKVIIISSDHKSKLRIVKSTFPELETWKYQVKQEFVFHTNLQDKTKLIIVNQHATTLDELLEIKFKNKRIE